MVFIGYALSLYLVIHVDEERTSEMQFSYRTGLYMGGAGIEHPFLQASKKEHVWLFIHLHDFFQKKCFLTFPL